MDGRTDRRMDGWMDGLFGFSVTNIGCRIKIPHLSQIVCSDSFTRNCTPFANNGGQEIDRLWFFNVANHFEITHCRKSLTTCFVFYMGEVEWDAYSRWYMWTSLNSESILTLSILNNVDVTKMGGNRKVLKHEFVFLILKRGMQVDLWRHKA